MQYSHSRIETFEKCPYQFKLRYLDGLKTLPDFDPADPLIVGTAMHHAIETDVETAIQEYYMSYPVITDAHAQEALKIRTLAPKVKAILPEGGQFEYRLETDSFIGFIDYIVDDCIYDFKYTANADRYEYSKQLHVYKYQYEKLTGKTINHLRYIIIPKTSIRQKKSETDYEFKQRLEETLKNSKPRIKDVEYDPTKVEEFYRSVGRTEATTEFTKNETNLCYWCEFQKYCKEGVDFMLLPKNERRTLDSVSKKTIWIYGAPFSGKTTLANAFPNPLMLNTDGNIHYVDAPYISIKDNVEVEGRITKITLAWQIFKDTIDELTKKDNSFQTIIVDLLEDCYEACRLYMYNQMGISHESDDSFRAWDKVRTEFLSTMRKLTNLDYENIILISHEDTSKDITKRSGDKITSIKPNINEKVANKVAGMVDVVIRCVALDGNRKLTFKTDEVVFGGGRLNLKVDEIPCDYDALMSVYGVKSTKTAEVPKAVEEPKVVASVEEAPEPTLEPIQETPAELPPVRQRRQRKTRPAVEEAGETETITF